MTKTLLSRIQQFNRYFPYLPGKGNKFDADDIREMVYPTYVHTIIATSDYKWYNKNKLDAKVCAYFDHLLVISALAQGEKWEPKSASKKQITNTGKKNSFNKKSFKHESSSQNKTKCVHCHFCNMNGHEEDMCCFKLKAMQEAQLKTKQKSQLKPKATSYEAYAIEQVEMSKFSYASEDMKEIPEMQEFLDNGD
jgi:hypothetical protein